MPPNAVGHRVVHGGPEYNSPVLINAEVLARLEKAVGKQQEPPIELMEANRG